jgi:O-antigen/teichoic acid export membrane protein
MPTMDVATARNAVSAWMTARGLVPGSVERRFATGVAWSLGATMASQGLRMIAAIMTARLLGRVGMGELGIVLSTVGAFGVFAGFGLGVTATKYVAELRSTDPVRAGRILRLSIGSALLSSGLVALVLFAAADTLAGWILSAPHLTTEVRLGSVLLFLSALNGVQVGALAGFESYGRIARIEAIRGLAFVPLVVAGVWFFHVQGALIAHVLAMAMGCWRAHAAIAQEGARFGIVLLRPALRDDMRIFSRFTIPAALSGVLVMPVTWFAQAVLANQPGGYGELGLLGVANQWQGLLMFVPQAFLQVALPLMSARSSDSAGAMEQHAMYSRTFAITRSLTLLAVFPAGVLLMFVSSWLMQLYGPEFAHGDAVLIGVVSSIMITAVGSAAGPALQAKGRVWLGLAQNASWGVVLIVLTLSTVATFGATGVAFSTFGSYVFLAVWSFTYLRSDLPLGTLRRVIVAVGFVVAMAVAAMTLGPTARALLALPAAMMTVFVSFRYLIDEPVYRAARSALSSVTCRAGRRSACA